MEHLELSLSNSQFNRYYFLLMYCKDICISSVLKCTFVRNICDSIYERANENSLAFY